MNARAAALAVVLLAAGCASKPLESAVATIEGSQLDAYWIHPNSHSAGRIAPCERGVVAAEYLIGSDGHVHHVDITGSRPRIPKSEFGVKTGLYERRFEPSPDNPKGYPVRVRQEFTVDCEPGKPKWR